MPQLGGCDLSEYQTVTDYDTLTAGTQFVIVRGGDGLTNVDLQAERNKRELRSHQHPIAHYWYVDPKDGLPIAVAAGAIMALGTVNAGEPIALDCEEPYDNLPDWVAMVARVFIAHFRVPPLIYTSLDFLTRYDWSPCVDLNCGLWLAHWDQKTLQTDNVSPWPLVAIKQYQAATAIPGVEGKTQLDVFYGSVEQFHKYGPTSSG